MTGKTRRRGALALVAAAALFAAAGSPAEAADVASFYKGRTVNLIIGYSVGGGYDFYARVLSRHLGRHIPGNPTIVPQNMPGAGSIKSIMYLYSVAPKDGTVFGTFGRTVPIAPLLGTEAKFDAPKLTWIGSITSDTSLCVTWHQSAVKTFDDVLTKPFTMGGEGAGSDPDVYTAILKNVFESPVKLVTGYPGTNDASLAMERGEIDGMCGLSYSTLRARHADWVRDKKVNLLVQAALKKDADLPNVPLMSELAKNDEQRQVLKLILSTQQIARPYAAPPGIPADRAAALRKAFDETMTDPEFRAEMEKSKADVNPTTGADVEALLKEVYASPKAVANEAAKAINY